MAPAPKKDKRKRGSDGEEEPDGTPSDRPRRRKIGPKSAAQLTSAEMEGDMEGDDDSGDGDNDGSVLPPPTAPYKPEQQTRVALEKLRRSEKLDKELGLQQ